MFFVIIAMYKILTPSLNTQTVVSGRAEDITKHKAIVIRNESIVRSDAGEASTMMDGVLQTHVADGEYVKRFKNVAAIYKNNEDESAKLTAQKLANITDRINQIENSVSSSDTFEGDKSKTESKINGYVKEFINAKNKSDARSLSEIKSKMEVELQKSGKMASDDKLSKELISLKAQKEQYEKSLANLKTELYSSSSGIFSSSMDGYEEILTANSIEKMTVSDFESVYNEKKRPITGCKIIDNYQWYTAIETDTKRAKNFEEGEMVYLRFDSINKTFEGTITHISEPKGGKNIITVTSLNYSDDITPLRKTEISLIKNIYSGLKVPISAVREVNGKKGVYAVKGKSLKFIEIEVLYSDGENVIVKEDNLLSNGLLLYDEVVTSGRNLYNGKTVK